MVVDVVMILTPLNHLPLHIEQQPIDHCPHLDLYLCLVHLLSLDYLLGLEERLHLRRDDLH
jgi:hypothetical protein